MYASDVERATHTRALTAARIAGLAVLVAAVTACAPGGGRAATAEVSIVAIGDSITEAEGWSGVAANEQWLYLLLTDLGEKPSVRPATDTWPYARLTGARYSVLNAGVGDDTTAGMAGRLVPALGVSDADVCIVFGGSNDIERGLSAEDTRENLRLMVQACLDRGVVPVMATVPPRTEMTARQCAETLALNDWIRSHARERGLTCADFFAALEYPPGSCSLPAEPPRDLTDDGVHPNVAGNAAMAAAIDHAPFEKAARE